MVYGWKEVSELLLYSMNWLIYFVLDSFEMASSGSMGKYDS